MSAQQELISASKSARTPQGHTPALVEVALSLIWMEGAVMVSNMKLNVYHHNYSISTCNYPDVDECSDGTHTCQQRCDNTHGAFRCTCNSGFALNNDGFSCRGECFNIIVIWTVVHSVTIIAFLGRFLLQNYNSHLT
jgi:hypothetical protein